MMIVISKRAHLFSTDFVALDSNSNQITKVAFLQKKLTRGNYIPIRLESLIQLVCITNFIK
jgi:hypothetical protein